jgi:hypothetical protein
MLRPFPWLSIWDTFLVANPFGSRLDRLQQWTPIVVYVVRTGLSHYRSLVFVRALSPHGTPVGVCSGKPSTIAKEELCPECHCCWCPLRCLSVFLDLHAAAVPFLTKMYTGRPSSTAMAEFRPEFC